MMCFYFFFNDTATTEIYTLSLHDALPICADRREAAPRDVRPPARGLRQALLRPHLRRRAALDQRHRDPHGERRERDRKSTRLNSSHANISYAVFCLKKKTQQRIM